MATGELPLTPDWQSNPNGGYGTGLAVADLNGDGWVDFVVANGNDMARGHVEVFLNRGDGSFNANPTWTSADVDYNGHLDLADVDGDGKLDCAVAVYLGAGGFNSPGHVKLYRGNGDGTFTPLPIWQSADSFYCFRVRFGDFDNDGRPDLACATGDDYYSHAERRRIYHNIGGALETTPSWTSTESEYSLDVIWADFNNDGFLDLAFAGASCPNRIYYNQGGTIQRTAGWSSTDNSMEANSAAAGDVDGDGWLDLAIADNNQMGGTGHFKLYRNQGNGIPVAQPSWTSIDAGYGSSVAFVDIDKDGDLDLSTGIWWGPVRIYYNAGGSLSRSAGYTSTTGSVIENEVYEDINNNGLQGRLVATWNGDGSRKLFYFPVRPVRSIVQLTVNDVPIDPHSVYLNHDNAWVILPSAPPSGAVVQAEYVSSESLDLVLSNWDQTIGEYLFLNRRPTAGLADGSDPLDLQLCVGPNPSAGPVRIWIAGHPGRPMGQVEIVDVAGRRIRAWSTGAGSVLWDGRSEVGRRVAAGVYLARWIGADGRSSGATVVRQ